MKESKRIAEAKLKGQMNKGYQESNPFKLKFEAEYIDCPPGCETIQQRMLRRGEIRKEKASVLDKRG